jgi:hypothetical protein
MTVTNEFWSEKCPALVNVGFKVFSDQQLNFLVSLADSNNSDASSGLFRNICGTNEKERKSHLSGLVFKFYLAACWINLEIDINSLQHRSHLQIEEDEISWWGNLWQGIEGLETWFQVREGSAIWTEVYKDEEDEQPRNILEPVTIEMLEGLEATNRREFIEKLEKDTFFDLNWRQILRISEDQYNLLKYGETGFRLQVMLQAEQGNSDGMLAWQSLSKTNV